MNEDLRKLGELDRTIHEPARLMIVSLLSGVDETDFLFLQRETGLTKGNLSSHLAKLEDAGYVEIEKTYLGKKPLTLCRLTTIGLDAYRRYRESLRKALSEKSDEVP
jgi:DNA-binding transcriptional ArsR family regulator